MTVVPGTLLLVSLLLLLLIQASTPTDNGLTQSDLSQQSENEFLVLDEGVQVVEQSQADEEPTEDLERLNRCCRRQKKITGIGLDWPGATRYVDVGQCKKTCTHSSTSVKRRHTQKKTEESSCGGESVCEGSRFQMETHHLLTGPKKIQVTQECGCFLAAVRCSRRPHKVVFFSESPFETEIDLGKCTGPCSEENSCKPVRNRTISVDSPNGAICINTIQECACAQSCYRTNYKEVYFQQVMDELTNTTTDIVKEVDVGRCVGQCGGGDKYLCVLRDPKNADVCLMSLKGKNKTKCSPVSFETHEITTRSGSVKTIVAITECGCQ